MEPTIYRIRVRGRLTERLAAALEGMALEAGADDTVFTGEVRDLSQLYGLLSSTAYAISASSSSACNHTP